MPRPMPFAPPVTTAMRSRTSVIIFAPFESPTLRRDPRRHRRDRGRDPAPQVVAPFFRRPRRMVGVEEERLEQAQHQLDESVEVVARVAERVPVDGQAAVHAPSELHRHRRGGTGREEIATAERGEQGEVALVRQLFDAERPCLDDDLARVVEIGDVRRHPVGELLGGDRPGGAEQLLGGREVAVDGLAGHAELGGDVGEAGLGTEAVDAAHRGGNDAGTGFVVTCRRRAVPAVRAHGRETRPYDQTVFVWSCVRRRGGAAMEPIRIGWLGAALDGPDGGYDRIHRMAFDEAVEQGLLDRSYEFVLHPENGLPQGSAKNATDGFRFLVDEGCIGVAGAYSSDNAITVGPLANELQVPLISWCGTERLQGDYCFRLGNGDCGGDAALVVGWLKRNGHERVAVLSEISPNGEEYFRFFRQECRRRGVTIAAVETVSQSPERARDEPRQPAAGEAGCARVHGLRDAGGEGAAARGPRRARMGPAAHHGYVVHVLPDGLRQVRGFRVTTIQTVPTLLEALVAEDVFAGNGSLNRVFCGGEALTQQLSEQFLSQSAAELYNLYGPTECCIDATWCKAEHDGVDGWVPIGTPIANTQVYIVDRGMLLSPIGVTGELCISGQGLARGYVDLPEVTAERFVPNPFSAAPGARMYRTGDLARYRADGRIEFLGRMDQQVKLRGFRIELGEIETVLKQQASVNEAVVIAHRSATGDQRLLAYVQLTEAARAGVGELRAYLKERLPEYMAPSTFVEIAEFPLTASGKINRRALPAPDGIGMEEDYHAPRTQTEELLSGLWAGVLRVPRVGVRDNFFELGGHSLLATQLMSRVRETFGVELPLRELFARPTVAGLAEQVEAALRGGMRVMAPPLVPVSRDAAVAAVACAAAFVVPGPAGAWKCDVQHSGSSAAERAVGC